VYGVSFRHIDGRKYNCEQQRAENTKGLAALIRPLSSLGFPSTHPARKQMIPDKFAADLRAIGPTHMCSCGCNVFKTLVSFDDYELAWWYLEGECLNCDAKVILPCPADRPE